MLFAWLFLTWLFLAWAKLGCEGASRQRMDACRKRTSGHFQRTGYGAATTHTKLSGAAHARRVAGAAIARAQRFDPARAVRLAGIVPLLRQEALPPAAHMLRTTTRGRAVTGFGASRRSGLRRCGGNGAGSSASSRCSAGCGQAGAAEAIAPGRPIRHLGVV